MKKIALYTVPVCSSEFYTGALYYRGRILFDYRREEDGLMVRSGVSFFFPFAMREHGERCLSLWHIKDCFDTLVEVEDSVWLPEILVEVPDRYKLPHDKYSALNCRHYMIYLDSKCFEVIAQGWDILPEQEGTWEDVFPDSKQFFVK